MLAIVYNAWDRNLLTFSAVGILFLLLNTFNRNRRK